MRKNLDFLALLLNKITQGGVCMAQMLLKVDPNSISSGTVILMGMGTVFFGLICLIFICKIMGAVFGKISKKPAETPVSTPTATPVSVAQEPIQNKGELVAAISAAVAESMGTDVSKIRIHSIKKV
jgi:sodium pump decarboxylase gamma subunit